MFTSLSFSPSCLPNHSFAVNCFPFVSHLQDFLFIKPFPYAKFSHYSWETVWKETHFSSLKCWEISTPTLYLKESTNLFFLLLLLFNMLTENLIITLKGLFIYMCLLCVPMRLSQTWLAYRTATEKKRQCGGLKELSPTSSYIWIPGFQLRDLSGKDEEVWSCGRWYVMEVRIEVLKGSGR